MAFVVPPDNSAPAVDIPEDVVDRVTEVVLVDVPEDAGMELVDVPEDVMDDDVDEELVVLTGTTTVNQ